MIDYADLAYDVLNVYWRKLVRTTFSNRFMFDFPSSPYAEEGLTDGPEANVPRGLMRVEAPEGGLSDKLIIETSTTHAATDLTEYGVPGATGKDTILNATPGAISKIIPVGLTGFMLDAAGGKSDLIGIIAQHFVSAFKRLGDAINVALLGTGTAGLLGAIDSTTVYAGLDPAVYTQWAAYENTTGGYLSESIMEDVYFAVTGGDRRAREDDLIWLAGTNQIKRYRGIARMMEANSEMQKVVLADGRPLDIGHVSHSYNGRPIVNVPDFSTTQIALHNTAEAHIKEIRSLQVVAKPYSGDGELFYVTWRGRLMYQNKHQSGKASGLTA